MAWNPSTGEAEAEDHKFEASLGYIGRPYLKKRGQWGRQGDGFWLKW
jgi:hypothetical protein